MIYGELVGDCSISSRIQFPNMPDRPFDNIFEYNANHSFLLKSGGCIITKKIGDIGTITTVNSNGELKKSRNYEKTNFHYIIMCDKYNILW